MSSPEFTELKRLLACKRFEQPPPGYFEQLPDRVLSRIEREELSELTEYSSWWKWLVDKFDAKPVLACVYGLSISGLLLGGFRLSEMFESDVAAVPIVPWLATSPGSPLVLPADWSHATYLEANGPALAGSSVDPVFGREPSMLNLGRALPVRPLSFNPQQ